ncbi:VOC family protein [Sphingomonas oryzagri]|jgi:methylmalonyl-CoA/ethylmalonyl-CoA epimerase|uniref:VOC family protein n=1 Tax=Sphingomonas oryzagri TaxID=3042314 RepID=A0ABT6N1P1_9SPHN|nr:VOC family protein [Sphingomonas oryzagri]MDH7639196.1 VOC family protein [Sphingomonas oryzagri]
MQMFGNYVLHHVGVIFPTITDAEDFIALMNLAEDYRGRVDQWDCLCIFTKPASGAAIELVIPAGGPLQRFNKGAGGVHHYAYEVADIGLASRDCESRGMNMLLPAPIKGAGDFLCNFIAPLSLRGVQIELVQPIRS